jgi:asparagine synthase (glutamine-hydrolysing)
MSGICGIYCFDGAPVAPRDVDRQMTALAHLGPDRTQTWLAGPVGLGHLMMRITREDAIDPQPLRDGALALVADLRLDNREELAAALSIADVTLAAMPDSALLLSAYKEWGADCVEHLIGDFAFAVWDSVARTLTLARDHMGQRHIFYHQGEGFFAFAAEIKGLWDAAAGAARAAGREDGAAVIARRAGRHWRDALRRHPRHSRRHRAHRRRRRRGCNAPLLGAACRSGA